MKSKWKVTSNYIGDVKMYGVYRNLNTTAVDHSGNREYHGGYMESKEEAEKIVEMLNKKAGESDE